MSSRIRLLSTDFDGTLVSHLGEPALDRHCMELIRELQDAGATWAINTGRSVNLLESGLTNFEFQIRPDFILTTERDVFRPGGNGDKWEPFGDWNDRCARDHAELFSSAQPVLAEVIDYVSQETKARLIYDSDRLEGLAAESEEEVEHIAKFIEQARAGHPKFDYQRNGIYLRFCHTDYHKGAALAELARLIEVRARQHLRGWRSSQRYFNVEWKSRSDVIVPGECDPWCAKGSAERRRLCSPATAWGGRLRGVALFRGKLRGLKRVKSLRDRAGANCSELPFNPPEAGNNFNYLTFAVANASGASASIFPANRFVM